ncbi:hypothetical protein N9V05_01860 [Gammaproteobacteria bacterium]|nr:hypothetical protein [Gammaproteobacteria bacterium]
MRFLITFLLFILVSCGSGGNSYTTDSQDSSNAQDILLPGSVGSFQPLDIDD